MPDRFREREDPLHTKNFPRPTGKGGFIGEEIEVFRPKFR
jgi:hypothetical protein